MAGEHQARLMTVEEYFELERRGSDVCYEYIDGHVYMMAGGSLNHDAIKTNIQSILWNFLRGKPCSVYSSDAKVQINKQRYFHPDITITCDPNDRGVTDLIKSPRIVFEVLSPGTQIKDRTWKMQNYLALPSLEEYILVDSRFPKVEIYRREFGKWVYSALNLEDELELASIKYHLPVADIYLDVELAATTLGEEQIEYDDESPR